MSRLERDQRVFATEQEARAYAADFDKRMWAYDGLSRVYQRGDQWIVDTTCRDSCD